MHRNIWGTTLGALTVLLASAADLPADRRLEPGDLEYLGAFLLPSGTHGASRWGYGGRALTFYPDGDGGRGSLFGAGHAHHDLVGECTIPEPAIAKGESFRDLPEAKQLQPFGDVAGDLRSQVEAAHLDTLGGLAYLEGRLYWCFHRYYAVQPMPTIDDATHGRSRLTLSAPGAEGLWHIGPYGQPTFHQKRTANYMCAIPEAWADRHADGRRLATGKGDGCGNAGVSHGPALFAVRTPADAAASGTELDAIALIHYPPRRDCFPRWSPCDQWEGVVWLDRAVLFAGRRGRGPTCYGTPDKCGGGCEGGRGYHCQPYEPEIVFYDPDELALVAAGERKPHWVVPYARYGLEKRFRPTCHYRLGGMAYDPRRGRLYLVQVNGEQPIVHVWSVRAR